MMRIKEFRKIFAANTLENVLNAIKTADELRPQTTYRFHGKGVYITLKTFSNVHLMKYTIVVYRHPDPNIKPFAHEATLYPDFMRKMLN